MCTMSRMVLSQFAAYNLCLYALALPIAPPSDLSQVCHASLADGHWTAGVTPRESRVIE